VDVLFDAPGDVPLQHRTPERVYEPGHFSVSGTAAGDAARQFHTLRTDPELTAVRRSLAHDLERPPDKVLAFSSLMPLVYGGDEAAADSYACPMHPEVTATSRPPVPSAGLKLVPVQAPTLYVCPMHPDVTSETPSTCPKCGMKLVPSSAVPAPHTGPRATTTAATATTGSSGRTSCRRSTGRLTPHGLSSSTARQGTRTRPSPGPSASAIESRSGWSTR
jgi:hypothetical protein